MRQTSTKHAKKLRAAAPVRQAYLAAHTRCEFVNVEQCNYPATEVHEPLTRARGGAIDDPANMLGVCGWHHQYIHAHPAWSEAYGYLKSAYGGEE